MATGTKQKICRNTLKQFIKNNLLLLSLYLVALGTALYFIFSFDKKIIHLHSNALVGNKWLDGFFYYITYLGDGTVAVILLALVMIYNFRLGIYSTATFIAASLASISLKHFFFDDVNRPTYIFRYHEHYELKVVDGVHEYIHNSFPSGHATQAFAIFMCLAYVAPKTAVKILLLLLALLTAYSRVHLSQHWLVDVTAGSLVGTTFSIIFYFVFINNTAFNRLNKPIYLFIRYWRSQ